MMNSRVEKDFEDFIFEGEEILVLEKALFLLLDEYKDQLIRGRLQMKEGTDNLIRECLEKTKLHENFRKNSKYFNIKVKEYEEFSSRDQENKVA